MKRLSFAILLAVTSFTAVAFGQEDAFTRDLGKFFKSQKILPAPPLPRASTDPIHRWNEIAINASGLDHTPVIPPDPRVFGEQLGPCRSARAIAIVHIAIFDAVNAIDHRYQSYTGVDTFHRPISLTAAVAQAAHDTLVALYPSQTAAFNTKLAEDLAHIPNALQKAHGIDLGQRVAWDPLESTCRHASLSIL